MIPEIDPCGEFARDGLPVRRQGEYAEQKLEFIDRYLPAALSATRRKPHRVFLDMFAGPGLNRTPRCVEFEGSPLRAMQATSMQGAPVSFDRYIGINRDRDDHATLLKRAANLKASGRCVVPNVSIIPGDANTLLPSIMAGIPTYAYVCAFLDIESPSQLPWSSIVELRRRHRSVDLYLLFPLEMGWNRMIPNWRQSEHVFSSAFGCEDWRPIVTRPVTGAHLTRARGELLALYKRQLKTLWDYVQVVRVVSRRGEQRLYRMFHASNHQAGERIAAWAKSTGGANLDLFGG